MHLIAPILIGIVFLLSLINWVSKTSKKDKKFGAFVNQLVIAGIVIGIICIIIGESIESSTGDPNLGEVPNIFGFVAFFAWAIYVYNKVYIRYHLFKRYV